jgi:hypothetical protein
MRALGLLQAGPATVRALLALAPDLPARGISIGRANGPINTVLIGHGPAGAAELRLLVERDLGLGLGSRGATRDAATRIYFCEAGPAEGDASTGLPAPEGMPGVATMVLVRHRSQARWLRPDASELASRLVASGATEGHFPWFYLLEGIGDGIVGDVFRFRARGFETRTFSVIGPEERWGSFADERVSARILASAIPGKEWEANAALRRLLGELLDPSQRALDWEVKTTLGSKDLCIDRSLVLPFARLVSRLWEIGAVRGSPLFATRIYADFTLPEDLPESSHGVPSQVPLSSPFAAPEMLGGHDLSRRRIEVDALSQQVIRAAAAVASAAEPEGRRDALEEEFRENLRLRLEPGSGLPYCVRKGPAIEVFLPYDAVSGPRWRPSALYELAVAGCHLALGRVGRRLGELARVAGFNPAPALDAIVTATGEALGTALVLLTEGLSLDAHLAEAHGDALSRAQGERLLAAVVVAAGVREGRAPGLEDLGRARVAFDDLARRAPLTDFHASARAAFTCDVDRGKLPGVARELVAIADAAWATATDLGRAVMVELDRLPPSAPRAPSSGMGLASALALPDAATELVVRLADLEVIPPEDVRLLRDLAVAAHDVERAWRGPGLPRTPDELLASASLDVARRFAGRAREVRRAASAFERRHRPVHYERVAELSELWHLVPGGGHGARAVGGELLAVFPRAEAPGDHTLGVPVDEASAPAALRFAELHDHFVGMPFLPDGSNLPHAGLCMRLELELEALDAARRRLERVDLRAYQTHEGGRCLVTFNLSPGLLGRMPATWRRDALALVEAACRRVVELVRAKGGVPVVEITEGSLTEGDPLWESLWAMLERLRGTGELGIGVDDQFAPNTDIPRLEQIIRRAGAPGSGFCPILVKVDHQVVRGMGRYGAQAHVNPSQRELALRMLGDLSLLPAAVNHVHVHYIVFEGYDGWDGDVAEHRRRFRHDLLAAKAHATWSTVLVQGR